VEEEVFRNCRFSLAMIMEQFGVDFPSRPYIARFNFFSRLIWPSVLDIAQGLRNCVPDWIQITRQRLGKALHGVDIGSVRVITPLVQFIEVLASQDTSKPHRKASYGREF
jgi:hypothetical protein